MHYFKAQDRILKNILIDSVMIMNMKTSGLDVLSSAVAVNTSDYAGISQTPKDTVTSTPTTSVQEICLESSLSLDFCIQEICYKRRKGYDSPHAQKLGLCHTCSHSLSNSIEIYRVVLLLKC